LIGAVQETWHYGEARRTLLMNQRAVRSDTETKRDPFDEVVVDLRVWLVDVPGLDATGR